MILPVPATGMLATNALSPEALDLPFPPGQALRQDSAFQIAIAAADVASGFNKRDGGWHEHLSTR